jgi:predicted phage terminase large subunit-like protein
MSVTIGPQEGPQSEFLTTTADIAIYGGAAGGGKTYALLLEPLRHHSNPLFGAVIFRKTYPQISMQGGMWDEASNLYCRPPLNAVPIRYRMEFVFPSRMTVSFAHMATDNDRMKYDGAQIPLIGFDQLEHFSQEQFWYMLSRNRSVSGVRPYIRATCNPSPDSWLSNLIEWYIDQDTGYPIRERSGVIRWFIRNGQNIEWGETERDLTSRYPNSIPKSFTFISASVYDNKILLSLNPEYLSNLNALDYVEKERLLGGNWKIKPAAGNLYNRAWFGLVESVPAGGQLCRYFDFAGTAKTKKNNPDYTAGVLMRFIGGTYYIEDVVAYQLGPTETEERFYNICQQDAHYAAQVGATYMIRWEREPGSASKRDAARMMQNLSQKIRAVNCLAVPSVDDKIQRGKPFGAQAKGGNIKVLAAKWTEMYLNHMHNQPELPHDDIADASTGAFNSFGVGGWSRGTGQ